MRQIMQSIRISKIPRNVIALILGYTFWYLYSGQLQTTIEVPIPLSFYGLEQTTTCTCPETVLVQLCGKRHNLRTLAVEKMHIHIDTQLLHPGNNYIVVTPEQMFLPETIKMIHCRPSPVIVRLEQKENTNHEQE